MDVIRSNSGRIWVISDTHLRSGHILPRFFTTKVSREDIIIHLGDFVAEDIVAQIKKLARLEAVCGNCDPEPIRNLFPRKRILEIFGIKIGMTHGTGAHSETFQTVKTMFEGKVDAVLFGHTHQAHHSKSGDTLFFNPGSLTQSRKGPESFGLLHIENGNLWGELIEI